MHIESVDLIHQIQRWLFLLAVLNMKIWNLKTTPWKKWLLRSISPYGISKVANENLGYQYFINYWSENFLPEHFIHAGSGHPFAIAIQCFARKLAEGILLTIAEIITAILMTSALVLEYDFNWLVIGNNVGGIYFQVHLK